MSPVVVKYKLNCASGFLVCSVYILARLKVMSGWVLTPDCVHTRQLHSAAPLGDHCHQHHDPVLQVVTLTSSSHILKMLSARLGCEGVSIFASNCVDSTRIQILDFPQQEVCTLIDSATTSGHCAVTRAPYADVYCIVLKRSFRWNSWLHKVESVTYLINEETYKCSFAFVSSLLLISVFLFKVA